MRQIQAGLPSLHPEARCSPAGSASRGTVFACRVWPCIALRRPLSSSALTIMKYGEAFVRWEWTGKASPGASSVESPSVHCSLDFHSPSTLGIGRWKEELTGQFHFRTDQQLAMTKVSGETVPEN